MFTGIIETTGTVADIISSGSNVDIWLNSSITPELKIDQSVAHNGVCLTVVAIKADSYKVTAVAETLQKTNLGSWKTGDVVNLERSLKIGDRLDGHFVQGHVDGTASCISKQALEGSWLYRFSYDKQFAALVIEKGSICINGVSLTVFDVLANEFSVTIIPYTFEHTNFKTLEAGAIVNVEFDVLGKYFIRGMSLNK
jgi:riboflavin synthase